MQGLQDKLTRWAIRGIPFPREKLEIAQKKLKQDQKQSLEQMIDIRFLDKNTKSGLRGWSSSKLKTLYISKYKPEWLEHLQVTPKETISFNSKAREKIEEWW